MKIAFDTNLVIRLIVLDDEQHLKKVISLIEKHDKKDIFICYGVLIEAYFVLIKLYDFSKQKALDAFEDLLKIEQFAFEHETAVRLALVKSKKGFDFNDTLIGEISALKNVKTYTFDKGLKQNTSFHII